MTTSAVQLQHRRGSASQISTFTGAQGEVAVDTTNNRLVTQDGLTAGGWPAAKLSEIARMSVRLTGINFNSANSDNAISIPLPPGYSSYLVSECRIFNASASITAATCGLFTATAAGGTAIVTSGTAITVSATAPGSNNSAQKLTINNADTEAWNLGTLYFRVQNAEGAPATASVLLIIIPLF